MGGYKQRVRDSILPLPVAATLPAAFGEWSFAEKDRTNRCVIDTVNDASEISLEKNYWGLATWGLTFEPLRYIRFRNWRCDDRMSVLKQAWRRPLVAWQHIRLVAARSSHNFPMRVGAANTSDRASLHRNRSSRPFRETESR